jgi:hypothetical protein
MGDEPAVHLKHDKRRKMVSSAKKGTLAYCCVRGNSKASGRDALLPER